MSPYVQPMCTCALVSSAMSPALSPPHVPARSLGGRTGLPRSQGPISVAAAANTNAALVSIRDSSVAVDAVRYLRCVEARRHGPSRKLKIDHARNRVRAIDTRDSHAAARRRLAYSGPGEVLRRHLPVAGDDEDAPGERIGPR